jgi:hypothetical protein
VLRVLKPLPYIIAVPLNRSNRCPIAAVAPNAANIKIEMPNTNDRFILSAPPAVGLSFDDNTAFKPLSVEFHIQKKNTKRAGAHPVLFDCFYRRYVYSNHPNFALFEFSRVAELFSNRLATVKIRDFEDTKRIVEPTRKNF